MNKLNAIIIEDEVPAARLLHSISCEQSYNILQNNHRLERC